MGQNPLGFEPGELGEDARPGSGGESDISADEPAVDDSVQVEGFFVCFSGHGGEEVKAGVA